MVGTYEPVEAVAGFSGFFLKLWSSMTANGTENFAILSATRLLALFTTTITTMKAIASERTARIMRINHISVLLPSSRSHIPASSCQLF
ncbi:hypothetical protein [Bartonella choladocola]|uniref:hypothetical protein n=1 Tax=Bartonella choladocola TaxID=2750995 RepID=UPI00122E4CFB|nr:hypothetical protein [Bartonella choladocola]